MKKVLPRICPDCEHLMLQIDIGWYCENCGTFEEDPDEDYRGKKNKVKEA